MAAEMDPSRVRARAERNKKEIKTRAAAPGASVFKSIKVRDVQPFILKLLNFISDLLLEIDS